MKVRDILERAVALYHDIYYRRCTHKQYLQFLDDAIVALINVRPDAHEKRVTIQLAPGARQRLPDEAYVLIDVYANRQWVPDLNEYFDGKPVWQVARKDLDYHNNWYANVERRFYIDEFAYDIRTPKDFWVNPPVSPDTTVHVEIGYSYQHRTFGTIDLEKIPFSSVLDYEIEISDTYRTALVHYMLFKLFSVNVTSERDVQIASSYYTLFQQSLANDFSSELMSTTRINEPTTQGIGLSHTQPDTSIK